VETTEDRMINHPENMECTATENTHKNTNLPDLSSLTEGDIVEVIGGPFQGTATIKNINKVNGNITVKWLEYCYPFTRTIQVEQIKFIKHMENNIRGYLFIQYIH
jgi:transcription antitermination factor NusG